MGEMTQTNHGQIDECGGCLTSELRLCEEKRLRLMPGLEAVSISIKAYLIQMDMAQIGLLEDPVGKSSMLLLTKSCYDLGGQYTKPL